MTSAQQRLASSSVAAQRAELIARLDGLQASFESRALSTLSEPLLSTQLTMQQLKVLTLIAGDPDRATGHELAEALHVSVATMSGLVDRLVEQGMVQRNDNPGDRRVRRLSVTPTASVTLRSLISSNNPMPPPVLARMTVDDLRALVQGLVALDRAMGEVGAPASTSPTEDSRHR
jgi:DNA-binding MarR family transcriptional regulator